jgi:hypothetical protein
MLSLDRLELDGDFFTRDDVDSQVNITYTGDSVDVETEDNGGNSPNDPEPIFFPSLYLPPTRRSNLCAAESAILI